MKGHDEGIDYCKECAEASAAEDRRLNPGMADEIFVDNGGPWHETESLPECTVCGKPLAGVLIGAEAEGLTEQQCSIQTERRWNETAALLQRRDRQ
jgi:hypothetical protein